MNNLKSYTRVGESFFEIRFRSRQYRAARRYDRFNIRFRRVRFRYHNDNGNGHVSHSHTSFMHVRRSRAQSDADLRGVLSISRTIYLFIFLGQSSKAIQTGFPQFVGCTYQTEELPQPQHCGQQAFHFHCKNKNKTN